MKFPTARSPRVVRIAAAALGVWCFASTLHHMTVMGFGSVQSLQLRTDMFRIPDANDGPRWDDLCLRHLQAETWSDATGRSATAADADVQDGAASRASEQRGASQQSAFAQAVLKQLEDRLRQASVERSTATTEEASRKLRQSPFCSHPTMQDWFAQELFVGFGGATAKMQGTQLARTMAEQQGLVYLTHIYNRYVGLRRMRRLFGDASCLDVPSSWARCSNARYAFCELFGLPSSSRLWTDHQKARFVEEADSEQGNDWGVGSIERGRGAVELTSKADVLAWFDAVIGAACAETSTLAEPILFCVEASAPQGDHVFLLEYVPASTSTVGACNPEPAFAGCGPRQCVARDGVTAPAGIRIIQSWASEFPVAWWMGLQEDRRGTAKLFTEDDPDAPEALRACAPEHEALTLRARNQYGCSRVVPSAEIRLLFEDIADDMFGDSETSSPPLGAVLNKSFHLDDCEHFQLLRGANLRRRLHLTATQRVLGEPTVRLWKTGSGKTLTLSGEAQKKAPRVRVAWCAARDIVPQLRETSKAKAPPVDLES